MGSGVAAAALVALVVATSWRMGVAVDSTPQSIQCNNVLDSSYQVNIVEVEDDLLINTPGNSDRNYGTWSSDDPVIYGLGTCNTDTSFFSNDDCHQCLSDAINWLKSCTTAIGGHAVYDYCSLQYETSKFW